MKFYKYIILLFILLTGISKAQFKYSFSGYVVDLPMSVKNNSELAQLTSIPVNQFLNLTRVRLRPAFYLWNDARLNIEYEADALYSPESATNFLTSGTTRRQILNLKWNLVDEKQINITHYIDRLYLRQGFNWGNIIIGRQRISWGTGRIWNPTDLFNPINPANFSKIEKDGADVVSMTYYLGSFSDLNLVYNPQDKLNESNAGFRLRTNFDEYDVSFVGGYFDKRYVIGGDFAGNFFDAGIRGEGIISMNKNDISQNYVKFIFGMDNQFTSKLYGLFEYQFNGEGKSDKYNYDLLGLVNGNIINLSRNYLFLMASYQITPLFTVTLSNNLNLNDKSGYFNPLAAYSLSDNATLNLGALISYGKELTEYWYYPGSIYLQGELFF